MAKLKRVERALHPEGDPATELALCHAGGLLYSAQGRLEHALAVFRNAERMQAMLVGEHALMIDLRLRISLTQVRMGVVADARAVLDSIPEPGPTAPRRGSPPPRSSLPKAPPIVRPHCSRRSQSALWRP